jgi:hypothetical protein
MLSGANVAAQSASKLSSQQAATVEQLKNQLVQTSGNACLLQNTARNSAERQRVVNAALNNLDPILVGRNVVFSKVWLISVDTNKTLTRQQFEAWRNRVDKLYDCFWDLTGQPPAGGRKVFIDYRPQKDFDFHSDGLPHNGHAHGGTSVICLNWNSEKFSQRLKHEVKTGSTEGIMIHEMGHIFASQKTWVAEEETIANFLTMYALEKGGFWYGMPKPTPHPAVLGLMKGKEYRAYISQKAWERYQKNTIRPFISKQDYAGSHGYDSVYDFYLVGLVEVAGWDAIKKAIRSYNDDSYKPQYTYQGDLQKVRAREFFDRIVHFSGKPNVLRSLPDRGALLDRHLNVTVKAAAPPKQSYPSNEAKHTASETANSGGKAKHTVASETANSCAKGKHPSRQTANSGGEAKHIATNDQINCKRDRRRRNL